MARSDSTAMQNGFSMIPEILRRTSKNMKLEDKDFLPGDYDIICGRGKIAHCHPGNRRFRLILSLHMDEYKNAPTKVDKSLVIISIVDIIRRWGGTFVKKNKQEKRWMEISDRLAVSTF